MGKLPYHIKEKWHQDLANTLSKETIWQLLVECSLNVAYKMCLNDLTWYNVIRNTF